MQITRACSHKERRCISYTYDDLTLVGGKRHSPKSQTIITISLLSYYMNLVTLLKSLEKTNRGSGNSHAISL